MINAAIYSEDTGEILRIVSVPDEYEMMINVGDGELSLRFEEFFEPEHFFVKDGKLAQKTVFPTLSYKKNLKIGDTLKIGKIPVNTTVIWPDFVSTRETDGVISCHLPYGGPYKFWFFNAAHYEQQVTINVSA